MSVTEIFRRIFVALIKLILLSKGSFWAFKSEKKKPKTEGKSFLFHIDKEFPNIISITSEIGFYAEAFQFRNLYPDFCKIFWSCFFYSYTIV